MRPLENSSNTRKEITIRQYIEDTFSYRLNRSLDEIRPRYRFDVTCPGSVPEAITTFLESEDYEESGRRSP